MSEPMSEPALQAILEAALFAAGRPLDIEQLRELFDEEERPGRAEVRQALGELAQLYQERAVELVEVGSGFRFQAREAFAPYLARLWEERPQRYSRALLETLAIIAYRQPVTRGEIEEIRGVAVSSNIIKTLTEREWVRVVGTRDVPGRPSLYATTSHFLDDFNLQTLDDLPALSELRDLETINRELELALPEVGEPEPEQKVPSPQVELDLGPPPERRFDEDDDDAE